MKRLVCCLVAIAFLSITGEISGADCINKAQGQEIYLNWDNYADAQNAEGIRIYHSNTSMVYEYGPDKAFATVDPNLIEAGPWTMPLGQHFFVITGFVGSYESPPSNEVCLIVVPQLSAPTGCSIR